MDDARKTADIGYIHRRQTHHPFVRDNGTVVIVRGGMRIVVAVGSLDHGMIVVTGRCQIVKNPGLF